MDIRDYILILDKIRRYKLPEVIEWRLMKLPIDVHNDVVLSTLLFLIETYFVHQLDEVPKPHLGENNLNNLETYYQEVNLYYSFCKSFDIEFDVDWVYSERLRISELINDLLIEGKY